MNDVVKPRHHSRISPSMMGRVEACTASYFLLPEIIVRDSNEYAAYGTCCHEISERMLKDPFLMSYELIGETIEADGYEFVIDADMLEVCEPYVGYCRELQNLPGEWFLEERVHLPVQITGQMPKVGGLIDFTFIPEDEDEPVEIVDLKTGRQNVDPEALQLATYGYMVLDAYPKRARRMKTTIVQPRGENPETVRSFDWETEDVDALKKRLRNLFFTLEKGLMSFRFGDHCRFCPILPTCPKVRAVAKDAALAQVLPTPELLASGQVTTDDLEEALAMVPLLKSWANSVVALTEDYLNAGGSLEGAKLVRKRTIRRWKDGVKPEVLLEKHGVDPWKRTVLTVAQAEKALPKSVHSQVAAMAEKPPGALTLAIGEDRRTAVKVSQVLARAADNSKALAFLNGAAKQTKDAQTQGKDT